MSAETTPAPLDPSKVKAGDTVTVEVSNSKPDVPTYTVKGEVHNDDQGRPWVGPILLNSKYPGGPVSITLTDHQPAPKPEWAPGTTGTASTPIGTDERVMRTTGYGPQGPVWVDSHNNRLHESEVTSFVPDETRPLPTVDELAKVIESRHNMTVWAPGGRGLGSLTARSAHLLAESVLKTLRGEGQ